MPCEWYKTPDGGVMHVNRGRSRGPKQNCKFCHRDYYGGKLCDFPIGDGRTCDAAMCDACARTLGSQNTQVGSLKRLGDTIDVCPIHRGKAVVQGGVIRAESEPAEPKPEPAKETPCAFHSKGDTLPPEANQPTRGDYEIE